MMIIDHPRYFSMILVCWNWNPKFIGRVRNFWDAYNKSLRDNKTKFRTHALIVDLFFLKLGTRVIANTVCLPLKENLKNDWDYKKVTVAGWGYQKILDENDFYPNPDVRPGEGK